MFYFDVLKMYETHQWFEQFIQWILHCDIISYPDQGQLVSIQGLENLWYIYQEWLSRNYRGPASYGSPKFPVQHMFVKLEHDGAIFKKLDSIYFFNLIFIYFLLNWIIILPETSTSLEQMNILINRIMLVTRVNRVRLEPMMPWLKSRHLNHLGHCSWNW
jgi:hypothetical protein